MTLKKLKKELKRAYQRFFPPRCIELDSPVYLATRPVLFLDINQEVLLASINELQAALEERKLLSCRSGQFDEATKLAVEKFQRNNRLRVDGIVGPLTWAALLYPELSRTKAMLSDIEDKVRELQEQLHQEELLTKVDGFFGRKTERALKQFQKRYGLHPDGVCGPLTWSVLLGQRPDRGTDNKWRLLVCRSPGVMEQILMVGAVHAGIHFNPFIVETEIAFINTLITSYGLTCLVSPLLENLCSEYLAGSRFPLLRFSPYVLIGVLWRQVLHWLVEGFSVLK